MTSIVLKALTNRTYKCPTMNPVNPFILGSKGQGHESQKTALALVFALL